MITTTLLFDFFNTTGVILLETIVIFTKIYLLYLLFQKKVSSQQAYKSWFSLLLVLLASLLTDISWIVYILFFKAFTTITVFILRLAWIANPLEHIFLVLFLESFIKKRKSLSIYHYIYFTIAASIMLGFGYYLFSFRNGSTEFERNLRHICSIFDFIIVFITLLITRFQTKNLASSILRRQMVFIQFVIGCHIFIESVPYTYLLSPTFESLLRLNIFRMISPLLLTTALLLIAKRITGLRFLNYENHVQAAQKYKFVDIFRDVLAEFGRIMQPHELIPIVKNFYKEMYGVDAKRVRLIIRPKPQEDLTTLAIQDPLILKIENLFKNKDANPELWTFLQETKICIKDEIVFSDFYEDKLVLKQIITFLDDIDADVFLPVFDQSKNVLGSIVVERNARPGKLFTDVERDEMLIFTGYLSNILYLMKHKSLDSIVAQEKELREQLYLKHQEIEQYHEVINSFTRLSSEQRKIGLMFYKHRQFTCANQAAQDIIGINISTMHGHPLTKKLKEVALKVEEYKSYQNSFATDPQGNRIVISGIPSLEKNSVIIMIYYPEIGDILQTFANVTKDPSDWDYLLYLETTKSGQLINKLIPGSGKELLEFKISLLKTALSKKATLLELSEEDALTIAEILHLISMRHDMHILKLTSPARNSEVAIKLFGINPIFGMSAEKPLFEQLNGTGTLYIQNIHNLDLETQHLLADFLKFGFYKIVKTDQRIPSSVRIICSTHLDLDVLAHEGKFSYTLLNELRKTTVSMPSLLTLPEQEFMQLIEGFTDQVLQTPTYKNLLELTEKDKIKLTHNRPASIHEFKEKIKNMLINKSKKNHIYDEVHFDPAYNINDPDLAQAARLGKHALRDAKIMTMLWNKFKSPTKIAALLGVNRTTVYRNMKELNIGQELS